MTNGPLHGIRIIEFTGIGPGPYAGQLLSDMGAEVIAIDRPKRSDISLAHTIDRRGKKSVVIDLKRPEGVALALDLIEGADGLIEGNRPGVMERLGLGPDECFKRNSALVYGRMTGWGQYGPLAAMAGHDINYISLTGALFAMGTAEGSPMPPLNLLGDFGGGSMFLVTGMLAALVAVKNGESGRIVDAAIVDGVNSMMGFFHGLDAANRWTPEREANWLDGGAPYYRCYGTACGGFMAVGAIEPQFLAILLEKLGISPEEYGAQNDPAQYERQAELLSSVFAEKPRDAWAGIFLGTDACVTPVLRYDEASSHPHMQARGALREIDGLSHPSIAPVLDDRKPSSRIPKDGADTRAVLEESGVSKSRIADLLATGVIRSV